MVEHCAWFVWIRVLNLLILCDGVYYGLPILWSNDIKHDSQNLTQIQSQIQFQIEIARPLPSKKGSEVNNQFLYKLLRRHLKFVCKSMKQIVMFISLTTVVQVPVQLLEYELQSCAK